jgi:hypothetical protein
MVRVSIDSYFRPLTWTHFAQLRFLKIRRRPALGRYERKYSLPNLHIIAGLDRFVRHPTVLGRENLCVLEIQLGLLDRCLISLHIRFRSRRVLNGGIAILWTDCALAEEILLALQVLISFQLRRLIVTQLCLRLRERRFRIRGIDLD